jgi:hypothetical protein
MADVASRHLGVRHRSAGLFTAAVFGLLVLSTAPAAPADTLEYAVKGNYLYKFGPFVQWPDAAHQAPDSPVVVCIVGRDPFGQELDQAIAGQRIGMRPIVIRRQQAVARNSGCHIMFLGGSPAQSIAEAAAVVRGTPVLTVTDAMANNRTPGIIEFVVENNRVRFNIDDQAAAENGLVISSQLLSLARNVRIRG